MNISQGLTHAKRIAGTHQAIVCGDTRYNWHEFNQRTEALARGLASLGVQRGDRIAVLMLNCHRYLELYYASARMGAVIVPLNIRLARPEIVSILNDSETKVLADIASTFALTMEGGCHVFIPLFNPAHMLEAIQREKVTATLIVPTMINALLNHPDVDNYDFSSLRRITYGGSPMPLELLKKGLQKWGPIFVQAYGMTEAAPLLTMLDPHDCSIDGTPEQVRRLASCGKESLGVEVRVVNAGGEDVKPGEIGEIIARGPNIMLGYWRMPEATVAAIVDGWYYTGDLATIDEENFIYIVDRAKDMIISGGENIYCVEVENALYTHPAVLEAAVAGIPDETWGEAVHAVVVYKPGTNVSSEELISHVRTQIASYKTPRTIEFRAEALPKSGAGKILKRDLREKYWEGKTRRVN